MHDNNRKLIKIDDLSIDDLEIAALALVNLEADHGPAITRVAVALTQEAARRKSRAAKPGYCPGCGDVYAGEVGLRTHQTGRHAAAPCRPNSEASVIYRAAVSATAEGIARGRADR